MAAPIFYSHSVVRFPSFPSFTTSNFGKPFFSVKETTDRPSVSSVRADGNRDRPRKKPVPRRAPKPEAHEDNPQLFDDGSSLSPNKEKIIALFKRIQSSISKGEFTNSKKSNPNVVEEKQSAEAILEVLNQSRARGKGRTAGKKGEKSKVTRNDSPDNELRSEHSSAVGLKSTRPPSSFSRRSPIPSPRVELGPKTVTLPSRAATDGKTAEHHNSNKFEQMKLAQLKEIAKSKELKGYSKLKKSELVELLIKSLNQDSL